MAKTASTRSRRSFKNNVPTIEVQLGESQLDAHIVARNEALDALALLATRDAHQQRLEDAFASLPVEADAVLIDQVSNAIEAEELRDALNVDEALIEIRETTLQDLVATIDDTDLEIAQRTINAAIDERASFELRKNPNNANIHRTLKKAREGMGLSKGPARVMLAANVDTAFVNRELHDGSRYNVYAIDKVIDVLRALSSDTGEVRNAINRACMISLFRMKRAGLPFTSEIAKGCASDKHHVDLAIRKHLMRHTVSAVTAPTQASSTMQALETLGVVRREGSSRAATYHLTDAPIVRALEQRLMKDAA